MNWQPVTLLFLISALLTGSATAAPVDTPDSAEFAPRHPPQRLVRALHKLQLTADQKRQVALVLRDARDTMQPQVEAVVAARQTMLAEIRAQNSDELAVRQAARDLGNGIEELAVTRSRLYHELSQILDQDQQALIADRLTGAHQRWSMAKPMIRGAINTWIDQHAE